MKLEVPYETSGQELGETRMQMTKRLMKDIEEVIQKQKHVDEKYYILVHAKPIPGLGQTIKIKILFGMHRKPTMMLSCLLFGVDNKTGVLTLEWALPGNWPVWAVGGTNEPVPETIGSINELGLKYDMDSLLRY